MGVLVEEAEMMLSVVESRSSAGGGGNLLVEEDVSATGLPSLSSSASSMDGIGFLSGEVEGRVFFLAPTLFNLLAKSTKDNSCSSPPLLGCVLDGEDGVVSLLVAVGGDEGRGGGDEGRGGGDPVLVPGTTSPVRSRYTGCCMPGLRGGRTGAWLRAGVELACGWEGSVRNSLSTICG